MLSKVYERAMTLIDLRPDSSESSATMEDRNSRESCEAGRTEHIETSPSAIASNAEGP